MQRKKLSEMKRGDVAVVASIGNYGDISRRFMELGLTPGCSVECLFTKKGIKAYSVKGCVIAIRERDSKYIQVDSGYEG